MGDTISLSLTEGSTPTTSSNANLSGLTASSSDSASGTFNPVTLSPSTFSAATTAYSATVANDRTHAKLTPTVEDTGKATSGVRKGATGNFAPVSDGTASAAIALDVGANAITVRVTAEDSSTKDYTVTITRQAQTPDPPTQHNTTHWSDTLTAKAVDYGYGCGYRSGQPQCDDQLTNDVITYHGADYEVELVHVAYSGGTLQFILDREPRDSDGSITERSRLVLRVGPAGSARDFRVSDAMVSYSIADGGTWTNENAWVLSWTGTGLVWNENDAISLSLVTPPVGGL